MMNRQGILLLGLLFLKTGVSVHLVAAAPRNQFELTAPQINLISGTTQARLEQVRALVAERAWEEAIELLRELMSSVSAKNGDAVVAWDDRRYVSLRTYCHLQIARLPAEALAIYRQQVDPIVEPWVRNGLARRDQALLTRLVEEHFCSRWGDDALFALGELALERADYQAARRAWLQISPLLRDPPEGLAYPDTGLNLADVRARLVLVSIRAEEPVRAALELSRLKQLAPQAIGRLGGQAVPTVESLNQLLASSQKWPPIRSRSKSDWTTFASSPTRSGRALSLGLIVGPSWQSPVKLAAEKAPTSEQPLPFHPLVIENRVFFQDAQGIHAVDLKTGKPALTEDGNLYPTSAQSSSRASQAATGIARYTMAFHDGVLFARIGPKRTGLFGRNRSSGKEFLIGLDLRHEGLLTFKAAPDDPSWSFDGSPLGSGEYVYVAMRQSDVKPRIAVACFEKATSRRVWRTSLTMADTPASGQRGEITHTLLTLVGNRIYCNTNLGVVASLSAENGDICWLHRYDRAPGIHLRPGPTHFQRDLAPPLFDQGLLFVMPSDTPAIFALDAETGKKVWATNQLANALHLLGVAKENLIVTGPQLWTLDRQSGDIRYAWPKDDKTDILGLGRGCLAGREVFWPSQDRIYVLDITTGKQTRLPIRLANFKNRGANLIAAQGYLLATGTDRLEALGPYRAKKNR